MTLLARQTPKSAVGCAISRGAKATSSTLPCPMYGYKYALRAPSRFNQYCRLRLLP